MVVTVGRFSFMYQDGGPSEVFFWQLLSQFLRPVLDSAGVVGGGGRMSVGFP